MATRYDQKTKEEVVAYVQQYNEDNGRGGQSAAVKKWDLNPITVRAWLEKSGVKTPGKGGRKKGKAGRTAAAPKAAKVKVAKASKGGAGAVDGIAGTLQRMMAIQGEMASLEREFAKLKATL